MCRLTACAAWPKPGIDISVISCAIEGSLPLGRIEDVRLWICCCQGLQRSQPCGGPASYNVELMPRSCKWPAAMDNEYRWKRVLDYTCSTVFEAQLYQVNPTRSAFGEKPVLEASLPSLGFPDHCLLLQEMPRNNTNGFFRSSAFTQGAL